MSGKSYSGKGLDPATAKRLQKKKSRHPCSPAAIRRFFNQNMQNRISANSADMLGQSQGVVDVFQMTHSSLVTEVLIKASLHTEMRNRATITADDMQEGLKSAGLPVVYMPTHRRAVSAPVQPPKAQ